MLFWRFRVGVAGYLAYIFLVPFMKIDVGGFTLQWNLINIILLFAFFLHRKKYDEDYIEYDLRPLLPFAIYFGISLLLMPFQDGIPFSEAINTWRTQVMKYLILPFVIWNDILIDSDSLKLYRKVTIGCIIIAVLYGLFLTTMPGINPYMIAISAANGEEFNLAYAAGNSGTTDNTTLNDERLFGRISSVFSHPMTFGLFLGLSLFYLYRNKKNLNKWALWILTLFIVANIITCGVRSVLAATFIAIMFLMIQSRNGKLFFIMSAIGCLCWILFTYTPPLSTYIASIFNQEGGDVNGSSAAMRLSQFEGCLEAIKSTPLEGKGFGWTGYYLSEYGGHPTMLFFESLIFVVLCNSGIFGLILWLSMFIMIIKYNHWSDQPVAALLNSLLAFYIAYACITGEYGYMQYFIIFYILMLGEDLYVEEDDDKKEEIVLENEDISEEEISFHTID